MTTKISYVGPGDNWKVQRRESKKTCTIKGDYKKVFFFKKAPCGNICFVPETHISLHARTS